MKKLVLIALAAGALCYLSKAPAAKEADEKVNLASEDSFPASDPPGWTNVSAT